jgi:hypothetical protein
MWVDCQRHAPTTLPLGRIQYPLHRRLGGPQDRSGRVRKISPPPPSGIRSPDRLARTDYAIILLVLYKWPAGNQIRSEYDATIEHEYTSFVG